MTAYLLNLATLVAIFGIAAASMNLLIGYAGPVTSDWLAGAVTQGGDVELTVASDLFLGEG